MSSAANIARVKVLGDIHTCTLGPSPVFGSLWTDADNRCEPDTKPEQSTQTQR